MLYSFSCVVHSQDITIKSMSHKSSDISASSRKVVDNNNDVCALVKVFTKIPDLTFDGNVIEIHKTSKCYWVYLLDGTRSFTIYHRFLMPSDINVNNYNIHHLEGGKTYYVIIEVEPEIEKILSGDVKDLKMTKKRREMVKLDRNYRIADSLYRAASMLSDKTPLYEKASKYGWPLATKKLYEINGMSKLEAENHPDVIAQYKKLDEYLDWLYYELKPFDDQWFDSRRSHYTYRFKFSNPQTYKELIIHEKELQIILYDAAMKTYNKNHGKNLFSYNNGKFVIDRESPQFVQKNSDCEQSDREATYIFYQMKRLWYDIVRLVATLPSAEFHGIKVPSEYSGKIASESLLESTNNEKISQRSSNRTDNVPCSLYDRKSKSTTYPDSIFLPKSDHHFK